MRAWTGQAAMKRRLDERACEPSGNGLGLALFCTERFCIDDLRMAPHAVMEVGATSHDRIVVAVSDYSLTDEATARGDVVHARRRGEVERVAAGSARRWTNDTLTPTHVVLVSLR